MTNLPLGLALVATLSAAPQPTGAPKAEKTLAIHTIHFSVLDGTDLGAGLKWRDEYQSGKSSGPSLAAANLVEHLDRLVPAAAREGGLPDAIVTGTGPYELSGTVSAIRIQQWGTLLGKPIEHNASVTVRWHVLVAASGVQLLDETVSVDSSRVRLSAAEATDLAIQHALTKFLRSRDVRNFRSGFPVTGADASGPGARPAESSLSCETPPLSLPSDLASARAAIVSIRSGSWRGSGVIVTSDGLILTRPRFKAREIEVETADGKTLPAVLRPESDEELAVLEIAAKNLPCLRISAFDRESIASDVWAVGVETVTKGIVGGYQEVDAHEVIHIDAAINSANEGGPLLLATGTIAGISLRSSADAEPGANIAIPARRLRTIVARTALARAAAEQPGPAAAPASSLAEAFETLSPGDRIEVELVTGSFVIGVVTSLESKTIHYEGSGIAEVIKFSEIKKLKVLPASVDRPAP